MSRRLLPILVVIASTATVGGACADDGEPAKPPNVVVFLVDDLGWRDLGCYGNSYHETPRIDELAKSGMRFTDAYAACPVCSPTRASILTGRYPATVGLTDFIKGHWRPYAKTVVPRFHFALPPEETTFAELLKSRGYVSGAFGKWHLGGPEENPGTQGFDEWVVTSGRHFAPRFRIAADTPFPARPGEYYGDYLTRRAEKFLDDHAAGPFVLYLAHYAVHIPLEAEERLVEKYEEKARRPEFRARLDVLVRPGDDASGLGELVERIVERAETLEVSEHAEARVTAGEGRVSVLLKSEQDAVAARDLLQRNVDLLRKPEHWVVAVRIAAVNNPTYAAMCEHVDESLGRIVDKLDALGVSENTVLIFFSDNGGLLTTAKGTGDRVSTQHPLRDEKGSLYEGGVRVPCLVKWPGVVEGGGVSSEPVCSVDLFPTMAEAAGVDVPESIDGRSLLPLLRGGESLGRRALYWHYPHYHHTSPAGSVRAGRYKLIEFYEDDRLELYDLQSDPSETRNLASELPDRAIELRRLHTAWRKKVDAKMPTPNPNHDPERAGEWGDPRERGF